MTTCINTDAETARAVRIGLDTSKDAVGSHTMRPALRWAIAAVACFIAAPALALPFAPLPNVPRDICGIEIPPARYDRPAKLPLDGPHYVSADAVARECVGSGEHDAVGCTTMTGLRDSKGFHALAARVLIAKGPVPGTNPACTPAKWRASVLRHERAHVAGWPQNHPR